MLKGKVNLKWVCNTVWYNPVYRSLLENLSLNEVGFWYIQVIKRNLWKCSYICLELGCKFIYVKKWLKSFHPLHTLLNLIIFHIQDVYLIDGYNSPLRASQKRKESLIMGKLITPDRRYNHYQLLIGINNSSYQHHSQILYQLQCFQ